MRSLSAREVVTIWQAGQRLHAVDRAMLMLGTVFPEVQRNDLAALSLGERDALLLTLHEHTFGGALPCTVRCPACAEALEFTVAVAAICSMDFSQPIERTFDVSADGFGIRARLLDSHDLASIATYTSIETARLTLLQRSVVTAERDGVPCESSELTPVALDAVAAGLSNHDPQAEIEFELSCTSCTQAWTAELDVVLYLWEELSALAARLLREVDALARVYGWREADILCMNAMRRAAYLELAS